MKLICILTFVVASCAATLAHAQMATAKPSAQPIATLNAGAVAPDFVTRDINGKEVRLSDFKGKVVILDFWATWCAPCIASMPHTQWIAKTFKDQDVVVLAVCTSDTRAKFEAWVKKNQAKHPDLIFTCDPHDQGSDTFEERSSNRLFHVRGIPTQFVIDRDGKIAGTIVGYDDGDTRAEAVLAKCGVKVDATIVAKGMEKLKKSADEADKRAAAEAANPRPPFWENFGRTVAGTVLPSFSVISAEGKDAKLSDYTKDKTTVLFFVGSTGVPSRAMEYFNNLVKKYGDQNLTVVGLFTFSRADEFSAWVKANEGKHVFPVVLDPAGAPSKPEKDFSDMTTEEKMAFGAAQRAVMSKSINMQLFMNDNLLSPPPFCLVMDGAGKLVGGAMGYGPRTPEAVGNLVLRAGIKLTAEDIPAKVWTAEETKPPVLLAQASGTPTSRTAVTAPAPIAPGGGGGRVPAQNLSTLAAGAVAPDFVMRDINDQDVRLSDFKGKVVILDFWATWCGPCIASMPHTNELAGKYADQDVVVVASGTSDKIDAFKKWIPKNQPKYPNLRFYFDPNERDSATFEARASSKLYGVTGIPTQFVIGRDGVITATIVGNGGQEDARTEAALAKAGVKIEAARVAKGEKQLQQAVEDAAERAAAAEEEKKNPKPKFRETYDKLKQGEPVPDFTAQAVDGSAVKFSELSKGKTVVFMVWAASGGLPADALAFTDGWARRYADQGVLFVGLAAYGSREDFDKWHSANAAKFSFPVLFDPAGMPPRPPKESLDEMTDDEKKAFGEATRAHYGKVIPMAFTGGAMAPVPNNVVIDAQGKFVGFYVGAGAPVADSLGNLLLRAGVKLAPEDMPKKVFTAEETKPKPPEAKVELLKIGAPAPDFKATDAAGKEVKVSDFKGKVVILDFWATWCGPCLASMPHTQEVAAHYKDQGVVVLASCTSDDRKKFDTWVKRNQADYPDINFSHDPQERGPDRASHKLYGVGGIPQQFIIDRDGKVAALVTGYLKGEAILDAALAKAGIKVDPALVAKGAEDLKKRESMR